MLSYAEEAVAFVGDRDGEALSLDRMRFLAVSRAIEIVGEAATKISADQRRSLPSIDLKSAANMRNRLIHGYGSINPAILADTVRQDFPALIEALKAVLASQLTDEHGRA
ncbi:MAG: HepT-like ribonuclease domain-containing protein [Caulobacterales bacterium]